MYSGGSGRLKSVGEKTGAGWGATGHCGVGLLLGSGGEGYLVLLRCTTGSTRTAVEECRQ